MIETQRLLLRQLTNEDFSALCRILQDDEVMYAYEGAFSDDEARQWLDRQIASYHAQGFGLWAVVLKSTGMMIGQCGLTMQPCREQKVLEIGYLFQKAYWHQGYASEAAAACKAYAFDVLDEKVVYSIIRDTNIPSQNVARRNGMTCVDQMVKHYRGVDMPHLVFCVQKPSGHKG